ncbi:DbpA RNA binding domain protein [Desulfosarcina cetonica]|uniref:DEAD/DEAH box helicase n=1 Tax=Desulfosarcina cetonica TaxID=90730 RepID=UPI0009FA7580|nr:DEAD/DEAH box helicase [Desulfosarcina cetonica]VTR65441.1 DbpA RNA binding domain protein [Desulfosarcina cetonica]
MTFDALGLHPHLLKAIHALGFETPTPIQQTAIPRLLEGRSDLVGLAQTGTGKTAAFGLPMLQLINPNKAAAQGVVICPTRELCLQITADLTRFARHLKQMEIVAVYGGAGMADQIRRIKRGAQLLVATPGRLLDLMHRGVVSTAHVQFVVLDEADEMFSMGFQEDIDEILKRTPGTRRTWLFSATMPAAAERIAKTYMKDPIEVSTGRRNMGAENIGHIYYVIKEADRYAALKRLIDIEPDIYGLIFCRTRAETRNVAEKLSQEGYPAEALHGDLSQEQRSRVMRGYRDRALRILVATDVAARGIDVEDISHVIHYNLPDETERYTHRSGRTARAGKSGLSLMLVNSREVRRLPELERLSGVRFERGEIPQGRDICEKQLLTIVQKMADVEVKHGDMAAYLPLAQKALSSLSKEELIQRFVSVEFNRFLKDYHDSQDLNVRSVKREKRAGAFTDNAERDVRRFFINIGRLDKINEGAIVRWVCDKTGIRSKTIGQIHLKREFSFFEVDTRVADKVLSGLRNAKLDNRSVTIKPVDNSPSEGRRSVAKPISKKYSSRTNRRHCAKKRPANRHADPRRG